MNPTYIFKSYSDFTHRENKFSNGVSKAFAKKHPDYKEQNKNNMGCWDCVNCSACNMCYKCYNCSASTGLSKAYNKQGVL